MLWHSIFKEIKLKKKKEKETTGQFTHLLGGDQEIETKVIEIASDFKVMKDRLNELKNECKAS